LATTTASKRKFFDGIASQWDTHNGPCDAAERQALFVQLATGHRPMRILDIGCGTGVMVPHLRHYCPEAMIVEMDFSSEMLAVNRRKHGDRQIEYCCQDLVHTRLPEASFDSVLFFNALPHFESLERALHKSVSLLKQGGRIAVGHLMGSTELNAFHALVDGPVAHDRLPTAEQLADALNRTGLALLQVEERPNWYFVMAEKP